MHAECDEPWAKKQFKALRRAYFPCAWHVRTCKDLDAVCLAVCAILWQTDIYEKEIKTLTNFIRTVRTIVLLWAYYTQWT